MQSLSKAVWARMILGCAFSITAAAQVYQTVDAPGAFGQTSLVAVSNAGVILGNGAPSPLVRHTPFTLTNGIFQMLTLPVDLINQFTVYEAATGINDNGTIIGSGVSGGGFVLPSPFGWVYQDGQVKTYGPGTLLGINNAGTLVGQYDEPPIRPPGNSLIAGLVITGGVTNLVTTVGGYQVSAITGINNAGQMLFTTSAGSGYLDSNGAFTILSAPGATSTSLLWINDNGAIVGSSQAGIHTIASGLNNPIGIAVDANGNVYVADTFNSRIQKVAVGTGVITTMAGNGTFGFSGDGGLAADATLSGPYGVAVDSSGNLYIADTGNSRIRKVIAATGVITTVAGNGTLGFSGDGGPATSAALNRPAGIAIDATGNLYIADTFNSRIREVTVATGVITTLAGNGAFGFTGDGGTAAQATLNYPFGLAVNAAGNNVFIADTYNHRIREIVIGTGTSTITTLAGNGAAGFSEGPAPNASLNYPFALAVDTSGNVYVADSFNSRIRMFNIYTASVPLRTVAGIGGQSFSGDGGPATSAGLDTPYGVATDSTGSLYIADSGNGRVRRNGDTHGFLYSGGVFTPIDVPGALLTSANGINNSGEIVGSFMDATGTHGFITTIPGGAAQ